jgi:Serine dehydrogenase proteinase
MSRAARKTLVEKLQVARGNRLTITYITSTRVGHEIQIADDAFRVIYDHLEAGRELAKNGVDLFIYSNGGSGTVPWRIVSLIRQYSKDLAVLVPSHAFSAATLMALGADKIVMHKMGCLGPIDPSVTNVFNPAHPLAPGQFAPISVEDVTAYFKLVKEDVGITHEDELVQTLTALTDKIHPLAIGNVQRHHNQSRLMARRLLKLHMKKSEEHDIEQLIDNLKSNLFYHGHPINRQEAKDDLNLKVETPTAEVELLMWDLFLEYEKVLKLKEPFNVVRELELKSVPAPGPASVTTPQIVQQMQQLAASGIGMPGLSEEQVVKLAVAMLPFVSGAAAVAPRKVTLDPILGAYVESVGRSDVFKTDLRVERITANVQGSLQEAIKQEVLWQRWEEEK